MTVSNTTRRVAYAGDDVSVNFTVTFPFFSDTDLIVTERIIATGAETVKVQGVDYSVAGGGGSTGTVTATTAPAATVQWIISRVTAKTQQTDYVDNAALPAETLEDDLDRAALRDIDIAADVDRALKFPISDDTALDATIPSSTARASKYLGFDSNGEPVALDTPAGTTSVSGYGASLIVAADAPAARALLDTWRFETGAYAARPAASSFGVGFYFATDAALPEKILTYSDGTSWSEEFAYDIPQSAFGSLPATDAAKAGALYFDTTNRQFRTDTGSAVVEVRAPSPAGHLHGLACTHTDDDTFSVAAGQARSADDTVNLILAATMSKDIADDSAWSAGAAGNAMPSVAQGLGRAASTWYAVFLIGGPTGLCDWGLDTSLTAANLLAAAQAVDAGYTAYRRIGWVRTDGSEDLVSWTQDGMHWTWTSPQATTIGSADHTTQTSLSVLPILPPGPGIEGSLSAAWSGLGGTDSFALFGRVGVTIPTPTDPAGGTGAGAHLGFEQATGIAFACAIPVFPDASGNVAVHTSGDTSTGFVLTAHGWRDMRGREG